MLLSSTMDLKTQQVEYTQAFPQAELMDPVFMLVPQGWYINSAGQLAQHDNPKFNDKDHYLKLKCNLYGCKQAAQNWYKHLMAGLLDEGFKQSSIDHCLFLRKDYILLVYFDDRLFSPSNTTIDDLIKSLSTKFLLQDEGNVSTFLSVQVMKIHTPRLLPYHNQV